MPKGAADVTRALLADARTTDENAFKVLLVKRTLDGLLAEAKKA